MKKREKYKLNWAALLLAAALAVGITPAWAEETDTAELAVSVSGGAFTFDAPFRTTESMSALVLTDGRTGLSTTYLFCSATSQTRGSSIDDIHVCDADGREKDGTIGEITAKGTVLQLTTYERTVRIGFTGTASANTEFYTEMWVDGKAETVEAYVTRAVLITYIDPEKADPATLDTQLDGIHIYFDGSESTERFTAFDPETREYDVTLQAVDRVRRDTYTLNVVKKGTCAIVVPQIYRNGETLITGTDPLKEQWLTLASVGISDKDGSRVDTGTAAAEGALTIEISDGEVLSWTGRISSGNFSVVPHKAGKVVITLIYDDGNGTRIEEPIEHAVNYTDSYLRAGEPGGGAAEEREGPEICRWRGGDAAAGADGAARGTVQGQRHEPRQHDRRAEAVPQRRIGGPDPGDGGLPRGGARPGGNGVCAAGGGRGGADRGLRHEAGGAEPAVRAEGEDRRPVGEHQRRHLGQHAGVPQRLQIQVSVYGQAAQGLQDRARRGEADHRTGVHLWTPAGALL